jgi:hypothetical protein
MSNGDSDRVASRRGFGIILGGLAAGAVLGTTVVAHADDSKGSGQTAAGESGGHGSGGDAGDLRRVSRAEIDSLGAKLDAVKLSDNERALLVGLLSLAVDTIGRARAGNPVSPLVTTGPVGGMAVGVQAPAHLPSIRDQFRTAFTPGQVHDGRAIGGDLGEVIHGQG